MPSYSQYLDDVAKRIQDAAGKLDPAVIDRLTQQAITQRYSKDRPLEVVADVAGNGTNNLALPTGSLTFNSVVTSFTFEDGFSVVMEIEFPAGQVPPNWLRDEEWHMYKTPTGLGIQILDSAPQATDTLRITWTARHLPDGSSVFPSDYEAVCDYAAGLCCEALAAIYAQTGDSTAQADVVNYRSKSSEYLKLSGALKTRYYEHVGVEPDKEGETMGGPALAIGEQHWGLGAGVDRLTHPRYSR